MANKVTITGDASSAVAALGQLASAFASVDAQTKRTQAALGLSNAELARFSGSASSAASSSSALTSAIARYTVATRESVAATNAAIGGFQRGARNSDQFKTAQQSLAAAASAAAKAQIAAAQQSIAALQARIPAANAASKAEIDAAIRTLQVQMTTQQGIANAMDRKVAAIERARAAYLRMSSSAGSASANTQRFFNDTVAGAPLASASMVAFGQTLTDASFFAQSFSSGVIAIGNNLSQLVTIFTIGAAQAGSFSGFLKLIGASFRGPMGILFAVQAAIGIFQAFVLHQRKSKEETEKLIEVFSRLKVATADVSGEFSQLGAKDAIDLLDSMSNVSKALEQISTANIQAAVSASRMQVSTRMGAAVFHLQNRVAVQAAEKTRILSEAQELLSKQSVETQARLADARLELMALGVAEEEVNGLLEQGAEHLREQAKAAKLAAAAQALLREELKQLRAQERVDDLEDQYNKTIGSALGAQRAVLQFGGSLVEANSEASAAIKSTIEALMAQKAQLLQIEKQQEASEVEFYIQKLIEKYEEFGGVIEEVGRSSKEQMDALLSSVVSLQSAFEPATGSLEEYKMLLAGLSSIQEGQFGLSTERINAEAAALRELIAEEEERLKLMRFAESLGIVFPTPETFLEAIARIQAESADQLKIDIAISPFASEQSMIEAQAALSLIKEKMATALEFGEEGAFGTFLEQAREAAQVIEDLKIVEMLDNSRIGVEQALADTEMTFADKFAAISSEREKLRDKLNDPLLTDEQRASVAAALEGIEGEFVFRFGKMLDSAQVFGDSIAKIFNSFSDILKAKGQMLANEQKALADKRQEEIDAIVDAAKTQNRDLTDAERQKIESIKQQGDAEIANLQRQRKRKFETEKKFAIASAIVYGALGVARAFAENRFPDSAFIAASIIAATAAQVMTIRAQQLGAAPTLRTPSISAGRGGGGGGNEGSRRFFLRPAVSDASQASSSVPVAAMGVSPSAPSVNVTGSVHMRGADAVIMLENAKMVGERV